MKNNGNVTKILLSSLGILFGIIALILSFLPLKFFFLPAALVPGFIGFFMGVFAINISNRNKLKKGFPSTTLIISFVALFIGIISMFFKSNKIEDDTKFDTKNTEIQQEVEQSTDLQDAMKDLSSEDLNDLLEETTEADTTK
jgi:hypothetical protein